MQSQQQPEDGHLLHDALDSFKLSIDRLPFDIVRYYFSLMYIAYKDRIETKDPQEQEVLIKAITLSTKITDNTSKLLTPEGVEEVSISQVVTDVEKLFQLTSANATLKTVNEYVTNILGFFIGLVLGLTLGVIGLVIGFFSRFNVIKGARDGFLTGCLVGALLGGRLPKKVLISNYDRRMRLSLNNVWYITKNLEQWKKNKTEIYGEKKKEILRQCFSGDDAADKFDKFLKEEHEYEVIGSQAAFFSNRLKGYLGNHAWIRFKINNQENVIELGTPTKYDYPSDQTEKRRATGEVLIAMLVEHKAILKNTFSAESEQLTFNDLSLFERLFIYRKLFMSYKIGESDCNTYIDKILMSTKQDATAIERFMDHDKWIGKRIFNPLLSWLAPFNKNDYRSISKHMSNDDPQMGQDSNFICNYQ